MDTGTHLRAVWRRRVPVLLAAVLAALAVFALRSATPATWSAQADLYLVPGTVAESDAEVGRLTAFYAEIVRDPRVVADVLRRSRLPLQAADLTDLVDVTSPEDGQLTVVAQQPTPERAAVLADATAAALSAGAAKDQAEAQKLELQPLQTELGVLEAQLAALPAADPGRVLLQARVDRVDQARVDRLSGVRARLDLVRRAQVDDAVRAPRPGRDATLAFLLVLVLGAEAAALLAARRRGLEGGDPVPALESWTGLPVFRTGSSRHGPDESASAVRFLRSEAGDRPVYLVGLERAPGSAAALERLVASAALQQSATTWVALGPDDAAPSAAPDGVELLQHSPAQLPARGLVTAQEWTDEALAGLSRTSPGPCALVVSASRARRPQVDEALRVMRLAGPPPSAVVVDASTARSRRRAARAS